MNARPRHVLRDQTLCCVALYGGDAIESLATKRPLQRLSEPRVEAPLLDQAPVAADSLVGRSNPDGATLCS